MNNSFYDKRLQGDQGEIILKFLVNSMEGWDIVNYGVESFVTSLKNKLRDKYDTFESLRIKSMPDFVIINKEKRPQFVEVKTRSFIDKREQGKLKFRFKMNQIQQYSLYWPETILLIIHWQPPYFYVVNVEDINLKQMFCGIAYKDNFDEANKKNPQDIYDFSSIVKGIKELLPDLNDKTIQKASEQTIAICKNNGLKIVG